ncbi:MAG: GWxTD domain-containing protein [Candidatus Cloacimonadales bacterium]|nr:GWxTD domain-containing protein [Candidatus Cloacimonadota bacterium]MDX9977282.1 GWxTD domain-containing protein [Candidatus Cloacimonadales bacterium]
MIRKDMDIMNLGERQIFKKCILLVALLSFAFSAYAVNFNASVQRFLNEEKQTVFHINYKVFNNQLKFVQTKQGYIASLDVTINLLLDGQIVASDNYPYNIGAATEGIAKSATHYAMDKISLTLTRDDLIAQLIIKDKNSGDTNEIQLDLFTIEDEALMSDIEVSQNVTKDSSKALELFHRGEYLYYVDPIPIFFNTQDSLYFYCELYNLIEDNGYKSITENISIIKGDSVYFHDSNSLNFEDELREPYKTVPIKGLEEGFYQLVYDVQDHNSGKQYSKRTSFSIAKVHYNISRLFEDDDEEFQLISYFLSNKEKKQWRKLNETGKKNFIDRFWKSRNPNPGSEENEYLLTIQKRVEHANWKYSHYDKGWTSDMGRIYIKYGEPNEQNNYVTDLSAKYSRKDYVVWKYNYGSKIFMFMDMYNSGRYALIYSKNDFGEKTDPNWRSFFEKGWDASIIDETSDSSSPNENDSGWGW